jgi:hypothetical protein
VFTLKNIIQILLLISLSFAVPLVYANAVISIPGPPSPQGLTGATDSQGPIGLTGATGSQGAPGPAVKTSAVFAIGYSSLGGRPVDGICVCAGKVKASITSIDG